MKKFLLISSLISITLFSCKKNETAAPLQVGTIKDHLVNEKQAIKIAVLKSIFGRPSSSQNRMSIDKSVLQYFLDSQTLDIHMNWGWGGQYDGYYAFNNFNPGSNTFNYKTAMITNIRP